ncbi:MAG: FHA domain-containing protein [Actinomycetota bacterium]
MEPEPDADTVLRAPRFIADEPSGLDADTVIKQRPPLADVPREALAALRASERNSPVDVPTAPFSIDQLSTLPHEYSFSVNASAPIRLDAPAFIGRRPSLPRVVSGRAPRLVRVPSPLREVSSTHLELRQQGALVIVTDLRSTNGTVVVVPGRDPVKLRGGESIVAVPGTVVDVGDGNIVEILGLASPQTGSAS